MADTVRQEKVWNLQKISCNWKQDRRVKIASSVLYDRTSRDVDKVEKFFERFLQEVQIRASQKVNFRVLLANKFISDMGRNACWSWSPSIFAFVMRSDASKRGHT